MKLKNYTLVKEKIWQLGGQSIKDKKLKKLKKDLKDQFNGDYYIRERYRAQSFRINLKQPSCSSGSKSES